MARELLTDEQKKEMNRKHVAAYRARLKERAKSIVDELVDAETTPTPNCDLDGEREEARIILKAAASLQKRSAELHERIKIRLEKNDPERARKFAKAKPIQIQLKAL